MRLPRQTRQRPLDTSHDQDARDEQLLIPFRKLLNEKEGGLGLPSLLHLSSLDAELFLKDLRVKGLKEGEPPSLKGPPHQGFLHPDRYRSEGENHC